VSRPEAAGEPERFLSGPGSTPARFLFPAIGDGEEPRVTDGFERKRGKEPAAEKRSRAARES